MLYLACGFCFCRGPKGSIPSVCVRPVGKCLARRMTVVGTSEIDAAVMIGDLRLGHLRDDSPPWLSRPLYLDLLAQPTGDVVF